MLKSITIFDFQNHEYIEIDLDPVTVLVGDNGSGKSAIIRAVLWCALNKWAGKADAFIRWGAENAKVQLQFDNGVVARQKGKDGNLFFLNNVQSEGDLSRSMPNAIKELVNLSEDNFHEQLDPAFWFSLTAGQVAKSLNKIVNLTSIDDSLADISSKLRMAKDEQKVVMARLETVRNLKISLDWTKAADEDLSRLEDMDQNLGQKRTDAAALARKVEEMTVTTRIRDGARTVIQRGRAVIDKMDKLEELSKKAKTLGEHLSRIEATEAALSRTRLQLDVKRPRLEKAQAGKCPLCGKDEHARRSKEKQ